MRLWERKEGRRLLGVTEPEPEVDGRLVSQAWAWAAAARRRDGRGWEDPAVGGGVTACKTGYEPVIPSH